MMLFRTAPAAAPTVTACPKCGTQVANTPEDAQDRIRDLESQVRVLNDKAAAAINQLADYEDEIRRLRAQCASSQPPQEPLRQSTPVSHTPELVGSPSQSLSVTQASPPRTSSRLATLSSFFVSRQRENTASPLSTSLSVQPTLDTQFGQPTPDLTSPHSVSASTSTPTTVLRTDQPQTSAISLQSLQSTLETERTRRLQAETSLNQTQTELEELTAQLFGQANEMVAAERKARYKLEERVKVLENRDGEKRRRLERLEKALQRIERVRGLVERRNTVDGYDAAASLNMADSGSEEGDELEVTTISSPLSKDKVPDIKRKAVATRIVPIAVGSQKDKRDRDRTRLDRKGTV